jgi:hypothetical protein
VRTGGDEPALLWLTVGLLATDGFALQIKLKKAVKVHWCDCSLGSFTNVKWSSFVSRLATAAVWKYGSGMKTPG